jgi:hypothetical protein
VRLPEYADTNNLEIHYYLRGPFGGYSSLVRTKAGVRDYAIPTSYDGKPARSLKAVVYCHGYQAETLDYPSLEALAARSVDLYPKPLATVPLSGRVSLPAGVKADEVRVNVSVLATWECRFFNLADCLVPGYEGVASAEVGEGGTFTVALPDFAHDPVVSAYERPGYFELAVSEREGGKFLFYLRPEGGGVTYGGIPIAPWYAGGQVYVPDARHNIVMHPTRIQHDS